MAETIPQSIFDRLEREWRLIDPSRIKPEHTLQPIEVTKRLKISRFDEVGSEPMTNRQEV